MSSDMTIEGIDYISSKRAAELTGYAQDYVGQLARSGKIEARRVGGLWYVIAESILAHKKVADEFVPEPPVRSQSTIVPAEDASLVNFDGKTYVSAARAAKLTSYHQDYIGQLARSGKILSKQVGRRWYVDLEALKMHKHEKDSLLAAVQSESVGINLKNSDHVQEEIVAAVPEPELHYEYKQDPAPLFPPLILESKQLKVAETDQVAIVEEASMIPIRVVRTPIREYEEGESEKIVEKKIVPMARKSIFINVFWTIIILCLVLVIYNVSLSALPGIVKSGTPKVLESISTARVRQNPDLSQWVDYLQESFTRELRYTRE